MKKFKSFHCGIDPTAEHPIPKTAVEWANEWLEENPDVRVVGFRHSLDKDGHDVICILYEESNKTSVQSPYSPVPMLRQYDMLANITNVWCPECSYHEKHYGDVTFIGERYCPECAKKKGTTS